MLQLNDATAIINRTINVPPAGTDLTVCMRVEIPFAIPAAPDYVCPWVQTQNGPVYNNWAGIFGNIAGPINGYYVDVNDNGGGALTADLDLLPVPNQFFIAYRRASTTHKFTVEGTTVSVVKDISSNIFTEVLLGNDRFSLITQPIRILAYKEWAAALSDSELALESGFTDFVVRTANLTAFTPLKYNLHDVSGNNNHWNGIGNFSFTESEKTFPFQAFQLIPNEFSLNDLDSIQYNNVPVGSGYQIIENVPPGWQVSYTVSNGSPNTNISVANGEVVIVEVFNRRPGPPGSLFSGIYKIVKGKRQDTLWLENFTGTRDVKIP